jgi:hypothetical protein
MAARSRRKPSQRAWCAGLEVVAHADAGVGVAAAHAGHPWPRRVYGRLRASPAAQREIPARAGRAFSHLVISSVLSEPNSLAPQAGWMNRRIRYPRFSSVL